MVHGKKKVEVLSGGRPIAKFHHSLVLARWALKFFQGQSLDSLRLILNRPELEGVDEETGHTRFYQAMMGNSLIDFSDSTRITHNQLAAYDLRIVGYWEAVTHHPDRRDTSGNPVRMKYYQYLSLMVTELYLDWYFNRKVQLLDELNVEITRANAVLPVRERLAPVVTDDLDKVSFWEATGSGKTLLMHVNILQYKWYAAECGKDLTRVILLTPNEGLSVQHLKELRASGLAAASLADDLTKNDTTVVGVVDSNKLSEDGSKGMAVEAFEGKNLVMVDEGHHGSSCEASAHRRVRDILCREGFSFEYSATFGQAVSGNSRKDVRTLWNLYARNILFDYSYRYFFDDGYGKEALILNLDTREDTPEQRRFEYLVGNLLAFYQQWDIYTKEKTTMTEFGIAEPLCLFVGNTVNVSKKRENVDGTVSDVLDVVRFLADVLNRRSDVEGLISRYVSDVPVVAADGKNPFARMFVPLSGHSASDIYQDMLQKVFHAKSVQKLHMKLLKKCNELVLYIGTSPVFGVINIGDPTTFLRAACENVQDNGGMPYIIDPPDEFEMQGRFTSINEENQTIPTITILIGARKFMEGWSSWRVSAMGLLSVGQNEGTQIIQLFGRGVRLRGRNFSLKRSTTKNRPVGSFLRKLETLMVFGIRANYMARFKEYLEREVEHSLDSVLTLDFEIRKKQIPLGLKIPRVTEGYGLKQTNGFQAKQSITLFRISDKDRKRIKMPVVVLEDFARLQVLRSCAEKEDSDGMDVREPVRMDVRAFPFFDYDRIYLAMADHKARKGYRNLIVSKAELKRLADDMCQAKDGSHDWYLLYSRENDIVFDSFAKLKRIESLFQRLVLGYMDIFYMTFQRLYEAEHMEVVELTEEILNNGNFQWPEKYHFEFEESPDALHWRTRLEELQTLVKGNNVPAKCSQWSREGTKDFVALAFDQTLYEPLFYSRKGARLPFTMSPLSFDAPSEKTFLEDLVCFYNNPANTNFFKGIDFYLMRNAVHRSKGIWFAQAGNFYPDFLLWLNDKIAGQEYLGFIDPKGLRNVSFESPKLNFNREVKALQKTINKNSRTHLILNSVILSDTPYTELENLFTTHTREDYEKKNVFFLDEGGIKGGELGGKYLPRLFAALRKE